MLRIPTLITPRLLMEPLSREHSAGMHLMWSCPEVCLYSGPAVDLVGQPIVLPSRSPNDSDRIIEFFLHGQNELTRFRWALISHTDQDFVGAIGFNTLGECAEIAFHMRPEYWGHDLMTEAAGEALHWVRQATSATSVEAYIESGNASSIRLARRLGLAPTGEKVDGADRYHRVLT